MATRKLKKTVGNKARLRSAAPVAFGPGPVPIQLKVDGQTLSVTAEPCLTLLQVLREKLSLTGAKQVCDRATCGACTVIASGKRVYACSMLAIDAQDLEITTIESLAENGELDSLQRAFVAADASQCGYCTSGFVMSAKAFLDENPAPTLDEIRKGMCGNLCRCGTYAGIAEALLAVSRTRVQQKNIGLRRRSHG
jgi:aerobic-type carbon monoxide dehydrogenase small subunit (CoxS/CutS family)